MVLICPPPLFHTQTTHVCLHHLAALCPDPAHKAINIHFPLCMHHIQHGINDIIHPVGTDVNPFRPWSDLPTVEEMQKGVEELYVEPSKALGLKVWSGTLLPIYGWRTYNEDREAMRNAFNEWLRNSEIFDGCIDFDAAVCDADAPRAFAPGFDSGDHLHPSEKAYEAMAQAAWEQISEE